MNEVHSYREEKYTNLSRRLVISILLMLAGVVIRAYFVSSISIVWIINFVSILWLTFPYIRFSEKKDVTIALGYLFTQLFTLLVTSQYISSNMKAIGTNINILSFPITYLFLTRIEKDNLIEIDAVDELFNFLSILGIITFLYAWITGARDIIRVFNGLSAYRARAYGFFYGKNIYGCFVSLTIAPDLFLLSKKINVKRTIIVTLKVIAVILSFSRAALLQMIVMIFLFLWTNRQRTVRDYLLLFSLIIIIGLLVSYIRSNPRIMSFINKSVFRVDSGDAGREALRNIAINKVNNESPISWITGVGFAGIDHLHIDIDNTYLYLLFSGGVSKALFYLLVIIKAIKGIFAVNLQNRTLSKLCMSVLVSYLFFAFFESVAILELGLLNFVFTLLIILIPICVKKTSDA